MQNFYFWLYFSAGMLPAIIACIVGAAAVVRLHSERVETDGVRGLAAIALVCGGSINLSLWTALLALTHVGRLDITLVWVALLGALVGSWYGLAVTRFKAVALAPEVGGAAVGMSMSAAAYLAILAHHSVHGANCLAQPLVVGIPVIVICAALAFGQVKRRNLHHWRLSATALLATAFLVMSWSVFLGCSAPAIDGRSLVSDAKDAVVLRADGLARDWARS